MKKFLLSSLVLMAAMVMSFGQVTLVDFETVQDPLVEPFDLASYESAVANPNKTGNTSDFVGQAVKIMDPANMWGYAFWGGINIYFGGDIQFTGTNDKFSIDFYTEDAGRNDSILFKFQLFSRHGGVETIEVDAYYSDVTDNTTGAWKTLEFALPDGTTGAYNQMVIFFGWTFSSNEDTYYFDNIVAPGYSAYGAADVTFNITDKFNNAGDVKLFVEGTEETLTQAGNIYSTTLNMDSYNVTVGQSQGIIGEVVYTHLANDVEVRDTVKNIVIGNTTAAQEVKHVIIVEEVEDGTAEAMTVGDTPPTIDGVADDAIWNDAKTHTCQERSWWGSPTGMYTTWKLMWDANNIYVLATVEDNSRYNGNGNNYENDCVEIFFDMNQSAGTPYDADDYQIRTIRGLDTWTGSIEGTPGWGDNVARGQVDNDDIYTIEMAIPWTSLSGSFLPVADNVFNFDITVADVASTGGARLYRESWTSAHDDAWFDTRDFGTVTLVEESSSITARTISDLKVYPNPANSVVNISAEANLSEIRMYDVTGRMVNLKENINNNQTELNIEELTTGIYIINVVDVDGNTSATKLRVY